MILDLEKLVAQSETLPILSPGAKKIIEYFSDSEFDVEVFTKIVESESSLSTGLLQVVNSPFVGFNREIFNVRQALVTLGFRAVGRIIFCQSLLAMEEDPKSVLDLKRFADDSFTTAIATKLLANQFEPNLEETAFTMGLLMNVGQILFAHHFPEVYANLLAQAHKSDKSLHEFERKTFLWDHSRLGAMLVKRWNIGENIILPICYHHNPDPPIDKSAKDWILIPIAYLANNMLEVFRSQAKKESLDFCLAEAKRLLDISEDSTDQLLEDMSVKSREIARCFNFELRSSFSYSKVLQAINIQLGEINLSYEQMLKELRKAKAEAEKLAHRLKLANEELEKRADLDGLTGIFNHRYFQEHLTVEFVRSSRYGSPLAIAIFDIDFFKRVNDEYGHISGDEVLREFAGLLKKNTRLSDFVARYGGEEFVIVLPETNLENAFLVAEKIRFKVENYLFNQQRDGLHITVSAGVSALDSNHKFATVNEMVESADKKLYRAKRGGRNQVVK
jgi:diguanylate cyclase (GGDEF)-like protein